MKKAIILATALSSTLLASNALAQSTSYNNNEASGLYLGLNYGYLKIDGDSDFDDDDDAYQLAAGYSFNSFIAVEGSYIDFGSYGGDLASADTDGYTLGLKLSLPVTDTFSVYAKGGQVWAETNYQVVGLNNSSDEEGLFSGLGISYKLTPDWAVKLDYTLYDNDLDIDQATDDIDDTDFSTDLRHVSVGVEYTF